MLGDERIEGLAHRRGLDGDRSPAGGLAAQDGWDADLGHETRIQAEATKGKVMLERPAGGVLGREGLRSGRAERTKLVRIPRTTFAAAAAVLAGAVLTGSLSAASPKERIREKQAQANAVLAQISSLDRRFEASVEAWHGAQYELAQTRLQLKADRAALKIAQVQRRVAYARVKARVIAMYESPDQPTTIGIIFGATSMSELLDRLSAVHEVANADHNLAVQTTEARDRYASALRHTVAVEKQRAAAVEQRAAQRKQIGAMLTQRKRLLASVQSEVSRLQAQEAKRQALLAQQARARLAAEQAELRRRAAEEKAAAAKAAQTPTAPTTTTQPATTTTAADPPPATTTTASPTTTTAPATTTTPTTPTPADPGPQQAGSLGPGHPAAATIALRYLGVPYVWGGASPSGFDCSGLVMYVFAQLGVSLPHYAAAQYAMGQAVPRDELQPGDLVFFDNLNHVGIYIGGGQFVHAPETGDVVKISTLASFGDSYVGARRI